MKKIFKKYSWLKLKVIIVTILLFPSVIFAAGPPATSELSNPLAIVLLIVIVGLLLVIALLANIVIGAAKLNLQRFIDEKKKNNAGKIASIILLCCLSTVAFAADAPATTADTSIAGLSQTSFYTLLGVIFLELIILVVLLFNLKKLLKQETIAVQSTDGTVATESSLLAWWDKINKFRPMKEEAQIDLGHDYDGIRELDNRLPPWWLYGFYACIIFAGIYLYRYHLAANPAPLSAEELKIDMAKADADKQAYLKKSANNIDETTAKLLTDPKDLDAAKKIFSTICAACHRPDAGGLVGPNLTDDYWLHGGNVKDLFKTIKYGYPDKGMKSWKDDYTPLQIEQLASYIKSLRGTNPPNPKAPQGDLYKEDGGTADAAKTDSTKTKADKK